MIEKTKKLKSSRQRDLLLKILRNTKTHPVADWLFEEARTQMPNISRGTIYRNLGILHDEGKIKELSIRKGVLRYDGDMRKHYHISCLDCGRIDDVPHQINMLDESQIEEISEYQIYSHHLTFFGICKDCQQNTLVNSA
ncbi:transcriptional repressor [bacterium]|nr:transcriptional repressor [bacterium]